MRAKLLRISGETLIDLLHGRLWVRNLPDDVSIAGIASDFQTNALALTIVSDSFPDHLPYNVLEEVKPETVNPSPLVTRDLSGNVLAVGLTRWIDPASPDALAAVRTIDVTTIVTPVSLPPVVFSPPIVVGPVDTSVIV